MLLRTCCYFDNVFQIFRPITLLQHMLITNQYFGTNQGLINSGITTLMTLLWRNFILWKVQCEDLQLSCFIKRGRKKFSVIRNSFIQWNLCESKKEIKFCNKLSIQVNLRVEFHRGKNDLYKSHKTMTLTSKITI